MSVDQHELLRLRPQAQEALMRYPGVLAVGLGFKERGDLITDEIAFMVYVERKKPPEDLQAQELIPSSYQNVRTDVLEPIRNLPGADPTPCADRRQHGRLVGGITITTLEPVEGKGPALGTLGFFATFSGVDPPYNIALVTNAHVVLYGNGTEGSKMWQPAWGVDPSDGSLLPRRDSADEVGTALKVPAMADFNGFYVDAASVKLNISISSWCHTNCGVSFGNGSEIMGLGVAGSNRIAELRDTTAHPLLLGETVYKVGRTTGRTAGTVKKLDAVIVNPDGSGGHSNIQIDAVSMQTPDNCSGVLRFFEEGDSGAALIDAQGRLVGLAHGSAVLAGHPERAHACQIRPVLDALGVMPITVANPVHGNPAAEGLRGDAVGTIDGEPNQTAVLRGRFLACEEGRRIAAVVERHRREVVDLINHHRRTTLAWHRGKGPAFLNRAMNNARDPDVAIPREIDGVSREALLQGLEQALAKQGSAELRAAISEHRDQVVVIAEQYDSLHDLVADLAAAAR